MAGHAVALEPHERDGWVLNLSYGVGTGEATFADPLIIGDLELPGGDSGEIEDGVCTHIGLGHMIGSKVALSAGYTSWMYEAGVNPEKFRFSLQNVMAMATWYPGKPDNALGGFHVRGGVGLAWSTITTIELVEGEEQGHGTRYTDTGLAIELNVGYEFRVFKSMGAGLGLGLNLQGLDGQYYESAVFVPFTLNLNWYWN
jgi:hypothetical protein